MHSLKHKFLDALLKKASEDVGNGLKSRYSPPEAPPPEPIATNNKSTEWGLESVPPEVLALLIPNGDNDA